MKFILYIVLIVTFSKSAFAQQKKVKEKIYDKVEIEGSFKGLGKFLDDNLMVPACMQDEGLQGAVVLKFIVYKNGTIDKVQVDESSPQNSKCLVDACIKLIKKSNGKWKAGMQNGKKVSSWHLQSFSCFLPAEE